MKELQRAEKDTICDFWNKKDSFFENMGLKSDEKSGKEKENSFSAPDISSNIQRPTTRRNKRVRTKANFTPLLLISSWSGTYQPEPREQALQSNNLLCCMKRR